MRHFASSIGPEYISVWHRDPTGTWTIWVNGEDLRPVGFSGGGCFVVDGGDRCLDLVVAHGIRAVKALWCNRPSHLRAMPIGETITMVLTVAVVVATHNLAIGVAAGVLAAAVIFARRVAHLAEVTAVTDPDGGIAVYAVTGQLFFASTSELLSAFAFTTDPPKSSSTSPTPTSGTPPPWPHSTKSRPPTPATASKPKSSVSTGPAPRSTGA